MDWSDHHSANLVTDHQATDYASVDTRSASRQTVVNEPLKSVEFGSGWYHDMAIAAAHESAAHPYR